MEKINGLPKPTIRTEVGKLVGPENIPPPIPPDNFMGKGNRKSKAKDKHKMASAGGTVGQAESQ